jgi:hypothetical protein
VGKTCGNGKAIEEVVCVATFDDRRADRTGLRAWSRTRWLVIAGIAVAIAAIVALIVVYGGGGGGGGGGY